MSENKVDVAELPKLNAVVLDALAALVADGSIPLQGGYCQSDPVNHGNYLQTMAVLIGDARALPSLLDQLELARRDEGELTQGLRERGLHLPSEGLFSGALASLDEWMGYARAEKTRAEASEARVAELTADLSASEKELATLRLTVGRQGGQIVELTAEVEAQTKALGFAQNGRVAADAEVARLEAKNLLLLQELGRAPDPDLLRIAGAQTDALALGMSGGKRTFNPNGPQALQGE